MEHLASDRVEKGLEHLTPANFRAALTRAVEAVASHVSTKPARVEQLLPMQEVNAVLAKMESTQPAVVTAWGGLAGGLGGLLGRVSQTPGDVAAPSASDRIRSLGETMQRDKMVSEPLHAFADDVANWEKLTRRLVEIVATSKELRSFYRLRQIKVAAALLTALAVIATISIIAYGRWVARTNVLAATTKEDPCAVFDLAPTDLERVSAELIAAVDADKKECEARRAAEARRIEEERQRKEREEAERRAKAKREADCDALAAAVEAGKLSAENEAAAADAGLTKRIAEGALEGRDFGPDNPSMPCAATKAEPRLWEAYRKAVLAKPWIMLVTTAPSSRARAAFVPDGGKMPFKLRKVIATRANDLAKFSIRSGKVEDGQRASAWCEVARSVGMPMAGPCDLADKIAKGK